MLSAQERKACLSQEGAVQGAASRAAGGPLVWPTWSIDDRPRLVRAGSLGREHGKPKEADFRHPRPRTGSDREAEGRCGLMGGLADPRGHQGAAPECGPPRGVTQSAAAWRRARSWGEDSHRHWPGGAPVSPLLKGIRALPYSVHRSGLPSLNFVGLHFLHVSGKY